MKHRIVAVSPQGKEYFGIFDESINPQEEWGKVADTFKSSDRAAYRLPLESGDTLIVPNIKDWYFVIQEEPEGVEDTNEDEKTCANYRFSDVNIHTLNVGMRY